MSLLYDGGEIGNFKNFSLEGLFGRKSLGKLLIHESEWMLLDANESILMKIAWDIIFTNPSS